MFVFITLAMGVISDAKEFSWCLTMYCSFTAMMMRWHKRHQRRTIAGILKEIKHKNNYLFSMPARVPGFNEVAASRGAKEEKAIAQLARSTGTHWLTASGSEQFTK